MSTDIRHVSDLSDLNSNETIYSFIYGINYKIFRFYFVLVVYFNQLFGQQNFSIRLKRKQKTFFITGEYRVSFQLMVVRKAFKCEMLELNMISVIGFLYQSYSVTVFQISTSPFPNFVSLFIIFVICFPITFHTKYKYCLKSENIQSLSPISTHWPTLKHLNKLDN